MFEKVRRTRRRPHTGEKKVLSVFFLLKCTKNEDMSSLLKKDCILIKKPNVYSNLKKSCNQKKVYF